MVLAGIGGRTVAEARRNISWAEFQAWMQYRAKHGPLHTQSHIEHAAALVAYMVSSTVPRGKGQRGPEYADFLPKRAATTGAANDVPAGAPIDIDTAMATWR
ncbi:MAG: hypothetical protein LBE51_13640 [Acidovorax sp.]|jgi:hypothetical protein|nr:hypothetical protein [Comamonas sp.]MDR2326431.1 hypothetical protein [Acidovorax sp.]